MNRANYVHEYIGVRVCVCVYTQMSMCSHTNMYMLNIRVYAYYVFTIPW